MIRKLFRQAVDAFEERTGLIKFFGDVMRHPVPPNTGWWYVFGSAVLVAFMMQVVTGIALATRYVASSGSAYQVLEFITYKAVLGNFLRGMHFFGASAMILLVGIHMIQVFLMGCYKYPREFNWLSGVMLLFITVAMGFSGQLLRWDQTAVWATVLAAEMLGRTPFIGTYLARFLLGGKTLGGATLSRFFAFHVFFLPAAIFALVALHLYLVIHDGISAPPVPGEKVNPKTYRAEYEKLLEERGVPFWPDAAWRDVVVAFGVVVTIAALAFFVGPPDARQASQSKPARQRSAPGLVHAVVLRRAGAAAARDGVGVHGRGAGGGDRLPADGAGAVEQGRAPSLAPPVGGRGRPHDRAEHHRVLDRGIDSAMVAEIRRSAAFRRPGGYDQPSDRHGGAAFS